MNLERFQAFGQWCEANGFGEIAPSLRSNTLWLADNRDSVLQNLQDEITYNNPTDIRSAYRKLEKRGRGSARSVFQ